MTDLIKMIEELHTISRDDEEYVNKYDLIDELKKRNCEGCKHINYCSGNGYSLFIRDGFEHYLDYCSNWEAK